MTPYGYGVTKGSQTYDMGAYGSATGGVPFEFVCPDDQVVTGIFGRDGTLIDNLQVTCSSLVVDGATPGGYTVRTGASTSSPRWADETGGGDFRYDCPDGYAVAWLWGSWDPAQSDLISRIGVSCSQVLIRP